MEAVAIVTGLAVIQLFLFSMQVGKMRATHGIKAPLMTGHQDFERAARVQMNTVELLIILLPGLWLFAYYVNALIAAALGLVYVIGRFVYRSAYMADPAKRSVGFGMSALPMLILVLGGTIGAVLRIL